jgi:hypothetical protein
MRRLSSFLIIITAFTFGCAWAAPAASAATTSWNFTVMVGLSSDLVTEYGGLSALETDVNNQLATVSSRFTGFAAPIHFQANQFYVYSDDPTAELAVPHPGSGFLLLYTEATGAPGGWYGGDQAILHDWPTSMGGVFAAYATDGLTHEFGHSRGAVDLYQESVPAANNPVSGASFSAPTSIMTYPYGVTTWDRYTIGIINHSKTTIYQGAPVVDASFPSMRVLVKNSAGVAVTGAAVTLYPVTWGAASVQATAVMSGTTGTGGYFRLKSNPFKPGIVGEPWNLAAPNFVVKATRNGHTGYGWLPLTTVGAWYFQHPGTTYTLTIKQT